MGTWGIGAFENDGVSDWVWELEKASDLEVLRAALSPPEGYLEAPDGELAVAASELVAAASGAQRTLPDSVQQWLGQHHTLPFSQLVPLARQALARVLGSQSELVELWEESDEGAEWRSGVEALLECLPQA